METLEHVGTACAGMLNVLIPASVGIFGSAVALSAAGELHSNTTLDELIPNVLIPASLGIFGLAAAVSAEGNFILETMLNALIPNDPCLAGHIWVSGSGKCRWKLHSRDKARQG